MDENVKARIIRYLTGECSKEEARRVEELCQENPRWKEYLEDVRRIWSAAAGPGQEAVGTSEDREGSSERSGASIPEAKEPRPPVKGRRLRSSRPSRTSRARGAARRTRLLWRMVALAAILGGIWLGVHFLAPVSSPGEADEVPREIVTESGERARIQLPDGTRIMLNVKSRLSIPDGFDGEERVVFLSGEAYFEVPSEDRPFIVQTEEGRVDVHGTAFNVRSYESESTTQVAVQEGQVSLHSQRGDGIFEQALLTKGQSGRLEEDRLITERSVDIETYLGWTEGRLVFDESTLSEVAIELERWYDIEVVIDDPELRSLHLTANVERQALSDVLQIVAASLGIEYEVEDTTVVLRR